MSTNTSTPRPDTEDRIRATAVKHAKMLEEKKQLRNRILDLVVECFDLPSKQIASPKDAPQTDVSLFKTSANLFQPSDFDDLVLERNIDNRCGYALCSRPKQKAKHDAKHVWSNEAGFFVDRAEYERWCSKECKARAVFVRAQLSTEPAWLRENAPLNIKLLDEVEQTSDLEKALRDLSIGQVDSEEIVSKLQDLSFERGDEGKPKVSGFEVVERHVGDDVAAPPSIGRGDFIEGLPAKGVLKRSD
jgi:RNA polymerase II-associated protein 2